MMTAISLWQPWASLMALGIKRNETRHWETKFRGELAICAAKRRMDYESAALFSVILKCSNQPIPAAIPFGRVVAVVTMVDCIPTTGLKDRGFHLGMLEFQCGNYEPNRFAWITTSVNKLKDPVPVVGRQGFFTLPLDVEAKVREQLKP